jgi:hypothetical protein
MTRSGLARVGLYSVVDSPGAHGSGLAPGLHNHTVARDEAAPATAISAKVSAQDSAPTTHSVDLLCTCPAT